MERMDATFALEELAMKGAPTSAACISPARDWRAFIYNVSETIIVGTMPSTPTLP
jgi:hypothetical protein